ncbi:MAG: GSCFA domain-containing protein [Bacteroidales bacterium]|nr:GSCFA domain-containing protein [Bacteroidales bacterium]
MKLITEVTLPQYPFRMDPQTRVLMMGSCFTEHIGRKLERYLFPVCINPFGVIYNPLSVKKGLEALIHRESYRAEDLRQHHGLWFSFDHYTGFSSPDREEALEKINHSFGLAREFLTKAGLLILTWGTSWVYRYKETGQVVCNCHKIPAREFTRTRLSTQEITSAYESFLPQLFDFNSDLKIIHTISPVRHWKDGAHGNQLSKATLLLAGDALRNKFPDRFFYFPSFEIVMDELRDYRYYADDMLHTSEKTASYIWEKFRQALVAELSAEIIRDLEPLLKLQEHRSLNLSRESLEQRKNQIRERAGNLQSKYPELDLSKFL